MTVIKGVSSTIEIPSCYHLTLLKKPRLRFCVKHSLKVISHSRTLTALSVGINNVSQNNAAHALLPFDQSGSRCWCLFEPASSGGKALGW